MKYILLLAALVFITCTEQEDFTQDINLLVRKFPTFKPFIPKFKAFCLKYPKACKLVRDNVVKKPEKKPETEKTEKTETSDDDVKLQFPWMLLLNVGVWAYNTFIKKK